MEIMRGKAQNGFIGNVVLIRCFMRGRFARANSQIGYVPELGRVLRPHIAEQFGNIEHSRKILDTNNKPLPVLQQLEDRGAAYC